MRIDRLDITSYGHLRDCTLKFAKAPAGLTVIVGPNEAGKSTVMRALKAYLFGIDRRSADHYGAGVKTLSIRGRLRSGTGEKLTATRQGLASLPLVADDGSALSSDSAAAFFEFADQSLFSTLFFIGHAELTNQSEALLDIDGEIGRLVFGAGLGAVDLSQVLERLTARSGELFKRTGTKPAVNDALAEYRAAVKSAKELRVRASDWEELDSRRTSLERSVQDLQGKRTDLMTAQSRLRRIGQALPLVAQREAAARVLTDLDQVGPLASAEWAQKVTAGTEELAVATVALEEQTAAQDLIAAELSEIPVDDTVLEREALIDSLTAGIERFDEHRTQRTATAAQLQQHQEQINRLLEQLHPEAPDRSAIEYGITPAEEAQVEGLAAQATLMMERRTAAERELSKLQKSIERYTRQVDDIGDVPDVSMLKQRLSLAQKDETATAQIPNHQALADRALTTAESLRSRLGLSGVDWAAVGHLPVPARATIDEERQRQAELASTLEFNEEKFNSLIAERAGLAKELQHLEREADAPNRDELTRVRRHRDTGLGLVKQSLAGHIDVGAAHAWSRGRDLPTAFEESINDADQVVDRRYDHAEQLTKVRVCRERLSEVDAEIAEASARRSELETAGATARSRWDSLWQRLGVTAQSPDAMSTWSDDFNELLAQLEISRSEGQEVERLRLISDGHITELTAALSNSGAPPAHSTLSGLIVQAAEHVDQTTKLAKKRSTAAAKLATETDNLPDREGAISDTATELAEWHGEWAPAVALLHLDPSVSPDGALATLAVVRELRNTRQTAAHEVVRLGELDAAIREYGDRASELVGRCMPGSDAREPDVAALALRRVLDDARTNYARHSALTTQFEAARTRAKQAESRRAAALSGMADLRAETDVALGEDLALLAERSLQAHDERQTMKLIDAQLLTIGDGLDVEAVLAEVRHSQADGDRIAAEQAETVRSIETLDERITETSEQLGAVGVRLGQIDGSAAAANLDQDAESTLARLGAHVEEYIRTKLAAVVLADVISEYGELHQRPFLATATEIFSGLTSGAFTELIADSDGSQQQLLARRANGELLATPQLSDGTRDQLYLALRLAGVRHHIDGADEPLPLLLDDILVNFDDERAAAALRVLADFGRDTQVLLFTHEQSIARLARELLTKDQCSVIELEPRRHDTAFHAAPMPARLPFEENADYAGKVLGCLAEAIGPIGKSQVLERTGIPDSEWNAVIKDLVQRDLVTRTGQKRGARYELAH